MRLTPEQRDAIAEVGHVCLVSCPGSGKTRVIVAKLLHCIESVIGSTRRVACITHTNAAADEVDSRLSGIFFGDESLYYEVATIHGFALQNILRPFHLLLPEFLDGFSILTSDAPEYSSRAKELIKKYRLKAFALDELDSVQRLPDGSPAGSGSLPIELQIEWCSWLDSNGYVTLNEIVYHSGRILTLHRHVTSALASRFAWILVDEFQDSSAGQILILREIHGFGRTTFFCVGDPNQSIYRFAGASPELLTEFAAHIGANTEHRLTGNFRSSAHICLHAERLCHSVPPMQAVGEHSEWPTPPTHRTVDSPSAGIFDHFLPAVAELGVRFGEVAILAPWWFSLFDLARKLREQNIPAMGPGARPYKRTHAIAALVEAIGAYLESPEPEIAMAVQRAAFVLVASITDRTPHSFFEFAGRVVVCRLLSEAKQVRRDTGIAVEWIAEAVRRFVAVLVESEILSPTEAAVLTESAAGMVTDILSRDGAALTIEDLGIFARPRDCIQLLTIHRAKGREFEAVAVIDAHDGRLPHFSINYVRDPEEKQARYDETRRVVYVATTRAKRLIMFFSDRTDHRNRPTPFLEEMGL